jgi:hypothetical protein
MQEAEAVACATLRSVGDLAGRWRPLHAFA